MLFFKCPSVEWHNCTFAFLGTHKSPVMIPLLKPCDFFVGVKKSKSSKFSIR